MFSGGIEVERWLKMVNEFQITSYSVKILANNLQLLSVHQNEIIPK